LAFECWKLRGAEGDQNRMPEVVERPLRAHAARTENSAAEAGIADISQEKGKKADCIPPEEKWGDRQDREFFEEETQLLKCK